MRTVSIQISQHFYSLVYLKRDCCAVWSGSFLFANAVRHLSLKTDKAENISFCLIWPRDRFCTGSYGVPRGSKAPIRYLKYGSTRKNTGPLVNLRFDPYFRSYNIRVDPQNTGRPVYLRVIIFTGRPVFYGSTCNYGSTRIFTGRPVFLKYGSTRIGVFDPLGTP